MGDGLEGVTLDRYGAHWQLQFFGTQHLGDEKRLVEAIREVCSPKFLAVKYRLEPSGRALASPRMRVAIGAENDSATEVEEYGCRFAVDLLDTVNPGLFLDMRDIRNTVGMLSESCEVLNLFSYTCSFGVHARMNGAIRSVNVDVSGKILDKGRANYALNGLACLQGEFFKGDSAEYLDWAVRKQKRFDVIILDPPSFARNKNGVFSVKEHMAELICRCARILNDGGYLMVSTNYSSWTPDLLGEIAQDAFRSIGCLGEIQWTKSQGPDFPGSGQMKESSLAAVLLRGHEL